MNRVMLPLILTLICIFSIQNIENHGLWNSYNKTIYSGYINSQNTITKIEKTYLSCKFKSMNRKSLKKNTFKNVLNKKKI